VVVMERALLWLRFDALSSNGNKPTFLRRVMSPFYGENGDSRFDRNVHTFYLLAWYRTTYFLRWAKSFL